MFLVSSASPAPAARLWQADTPAHAALRLAIMITAGVALLGISANFKLPIGPVPVSLQTFVVLVLGAAYGLRASVATMLAYYAVGIAGAPVFAGGVGLLTFVGPTGGYLLGFLPAIALVGWAADNRRAWLMVPTMVAATVVIFALGLSWLAALAQVFGGWDKALGWQGAVAVGLTPFLLSEAVKVAVAMATALGWRALSARD